MVVAKTVKLELRGECSRGATVSTDNTNYLVQLRSHCSTVAAQNVFGGPNMVERNQEA